METLKMDKELKQALLTGAAGAAVVTAGTNLIGDPTLLESLIAAGITFPIFTGYVFAREKLRKWAFGQTNNENNSENELR